MEEGPGPEPTSQPREDAQSPCSDSLGGKRKGHSVLFSELGGSASGTGKRQSDACPAWALLSSVFTPGDSGQKDPGLMLLFPSCLHLLSFWTGLLKHLGQKEQSCRQTLCGSSEPVL
ncbi:protein FAM200A isoform X2 [Vulpes lagopus]|uniref:protein FAM200A isoform X2 n=1 Tax=Vulpes lagopus TaxID=494514 RepID=UPI001BC8F2DE|nr:protein FAM200A isoform X2 [Vulpes lagopus]